VTCESSLWAHELDLLQRDLLDRMNESLGPDEGASVTRLTFKVGSPPNRP
jgi:predicted nucleic acid-binding Zn ribbon protein